MTQISTGTMRRKPSPLVAALALIGALTMSVVAVAAPPPGQPPAQPKDDATPAVNPDDLPIKPPVSRPRVIEVLTATLGGRFDSQPCDALAAVTAVCDHRYSCSVPISSALCPAAGKLNQPGGAGSLIRTLKVGYRCSVGEKPHTKMTDEPFTMRIACGAGRR